MSTVESYNNIISNVDSNVNSKTSSSSETQNELDKDAFLNLLVTQMQYQDPLNPTSDQEYLAQMAQFSALEQAENMNSTASQSKAFSLIGKNIEGTIKDEDTNELQEAGGVVESVKMIDGNILLSIGDKDINLDSITKVIETTPTEDMVLIDKVTELTKTVEELKTIVSKYTVENIPTED